MTTIFSKIISREIEGVFVYEDDVCVVLMDKFPVVAGQTLVIPRLEVDYIFNLPKETYDHLFEVAKKIALASDKAFNTTRTCLAVEGFEVPHVHIKLYPMMIGPDKNLAQTIAEQYEESDDKLKQYSKLIKKFIT